MSISVPPWVERLLGVESGQGEGTVLRLEHTWDWAPWVTLLFAVFAVVFVVSVYLRENREASRPFRLALAAIRLALVAIVLAMLAQYALSFQRTGLPYMVILVDDSLSMTTVDRYDEPLREKIASRVQRAGLEGLSRWNLARTVLARRNAALMRAVGRGYKLRLYFVTGARASQADTLEQQLEALDALEPTGESTRLGAAVRAILDDLRGTAPAAIVVLSDGINTDGPDLADAAEYARRKGVPLFTVGLGDDEPMRDLELGDLLVDDVVFAGDVVNFEFQLSGTGFEGRRVEIVLRDRDRPGELARMEAKVEGRSQRLRLPYRPPEVGKFRYVVEVEPLEGELDAENNRLERTVTVSDEKVRVLFVCGYPSYEYRYLANMLHRDGSIELSTVLQSAHPEHAEQSETALRGFPVRREELFQYNVIILGDADPAQFSASMIENLVDFVYNQEAEGKQGKGGALVCIAGPESMPRAYRDTPLAPLLPIELASVAEESPDGTDPFVVQPTELGLASPSMQLGDTPAETRRIWHNLPPLYWLLKVGGVKPGAVVLARHPELVDHEGRGLPLICMHYVGAGKVWFHATDETWRWRWRVGDVFFARYWVQTIRFLSRAKLSEGDLSAVLTADRRKYERGESVRLRVRFADERLAPPADDGVTVVLEHKGHKTRRIQLRRNAVARGVFEGRVSKPPIGSYHAWMAIPALEGRTPSVDFEVEAPPGEFERVRMAAAELKRAAHDTRGRFYTFLDAERLLGDLPPGRQVPIESLPPKPLWNTWPLLLLFFALLTTEWILRKLGGMV